jgi:hypothetical protein
MTWNLSKAKPEALRTHLCIVNPEYLQWLANHMHRSSSDSNTCKTSRYNTTEASIDAAVTRPKTKIKVQFCPPKLKILVMLLTLNYFTNYELIGNFVLKKKK